MTHILRQDLRNTGVLIRPYPVQEGNKLMFQNGVNFLRRLVLQRKKKT